MHTLIVSLLEVALQSLEKEGIVPNGANYALVVHAHRQLEGRWISALAISMASQMNASPQDMAVCLQRALPQHALIESVELTDAGLLVFASSYLELSRIVATIVGSQGFQVSNLEELNASKHPLYNVFRRSCSILDAISAQDVVWDRAIGLASIAKLEMSEETKLVRMLYEAWQSRGAIADLDKRFNSLLAKCVQNYYNAVALLAMPKAASAARLCLLEAIARVLYERLSETTKLAEN